MHCKYIFICVYKLYMTQRVIEIDNILYSITLLDPEYCFSQTYGIQPKIGSYNVYRRFIGAALIGNFFDAPFLFQNLNFM